MTYLDTWEEFAAASESLYQSDSINVCTQVFAIA